MTNASCFRKAYQLLVFFLRRVVGLCFGCLQTLNIWKPTRRLSELKTRESAVVQCRVITQWKTDIVDVCCPDDFLLMSEQELLPLSVLLAPHTSLYCVTPDVAVFVTTCSSCAVYSSTTSPFFYIAQFSNASQVLVTTTNWLHRLASEITGKCRVPITWLSNTGRCGSTLLTQLLETVPGTLCLSEPDAVFNVALLAHHGLVDCEQKSLLLKSVISLLVHGAVMQGDFCGQRVGRVVVKTRSECTSLIWDIHCLFPHIDHLFMYRGMFQVLRSFKCLGQEFYMPLVKMIDSDLIAALTSSYRMTMFSRTFTGGENEKKTMVDLVPSLSFVGILATQLCSQIQLIQRLQAEGLSIPSIMYEDLMENPDQTIGHLFSVLEIPQKYVSTSLVVLARRSQAGVSRMDLSALPESRKSFSSREQRDIEAVSQRLGLITKSGHIHFTQRIDQN